MSTASRGTTHRGNAVGGCENYRAAGARQRATSVGPFGELSPPLQVLGRLVPLTYAEDVLIPVFRDGQPAADRLGYLVLLGAYGAAPVAVASLTLREHE
jgi:hypothetical protein